MPDEVTFRTILPLLFPQAGFVVATVKAIAEGVKQVPPLQLPTVTSLIGCNSPCPGSPVWHLAERVKGCILPHITNSSRGSLVNLFR